ncbi:hypothetical protein KAJ27_12105 [bacterium]|nr:hypothetical protein [bacterium]
MNNFFRSLMAIFTVVSVICFTSGCCGQESKKKSVIILKKPGSVDTLSVAKKIEVVSESRNVVKKIVQSKKVLSGEMSSVSEKVSPDLSNVDLESLKYVDYDKYLELKNKFKTRINTNSGMTGKMKGKFQQNVKALFADVKNAIKNDGEKSLERYSKRLNTAIIRFLSRNKMNEVEVKETGKFIRVCLLTSFVSESEKKWSKNFLTEISNLVQQDNSISTSGKSIIESLSDK